MMTPLVVTTDIATTEAFALAGPCRIRADDLTYGQFVDIYEERVDGDYELVKATGRGPMVQLTKGNNSILFEGYGSYKCVISEAGIVVGYDVG
jgi:hypothetical protein